MLGSEVVRTAEGVVSLEELESFVPEEEFEVSTFSGARWLPGGSALGNE